MFYVLLILRLMITFMIGLLGFYLGKFLGKFLLPIQYHGPDSSKIRTQIFKMKPKHHQFCYRLIPQAVIGPIRNKI